MCAHMEKSYTTNKTRNENRKIKKTEATHSQSERERKKEFNNFQFFFSGDCLALLVSQPLFVTHNHKYYRIHDSCKQVYAMPIYVDPMLIGKRRSFLYIFFFITEAIVLIQSLNEYISSRQLHEVCFFTRNVCVAFFI